MFQSSSSSSSNSILDVLFIFIITVAIAYIFGFILVRMVDKRFDQIQSSQSIFMENFQNNKSTKTTKDEKADSSEVIIFQTVDVEEDENGNARFKDVTSQLPHKKKYRFDKEYYEQQNEYNKVEGFTNQPSSNQIDWTPSDSKQTQQVCYKNHSHQKRGRNNDCSYGVTNYADPKDMSPIDYNIFIMNYPPNFTMQDYVNWLWCFKDKKEQLTYNHLRNLEKLEMGKKLEYEEGVCPPPAYYHPPMNAEDYFEKLYNTDTNEFQLAESLNSTTGPMLGYNFNDYSEFSQNNDVYGLDGEIRNPDVGLKKTARSVDDYIIPHDSQNLEIEKAYKPFHVKKIEI